MRISAIAPILHRFALMHQPHKTRPIKRVLLNRIIINQQIFSAAIYESLKHCKSMPYMWLKTPGGREVASSSLVTPTKSKEPQNQSLRFAALSYYSHILRLISFKKH